MVAVVAPDCLAAGRGGLRALGAAVRRDRRGHRHRRAARVLRRRGRRRDPRRAAHRRVPALRGRAASRARTPSRRRWAATHAPSRADRSPNAAARWIYEQYDQLVGSRTVRRPGLDAAVLRLRPSLRGLAVSLDGPPLGERDPFRAGAPAVLERGAATSPAPAASRSRSPTASTSATRRSPRSPGSSRRRSRASRRPPRRSASRSSPATSRSTTRPTGARSRRRPSSAASGSSPTCGDVPGALARGRRVLLACARAPTRALAGRGRADSCGSSSLARAPLLSLAHDVADGGLAVALAEAALWSGVGADVELARAAPRRCSVLACAPERVGRLGGAARAASASSAATRSSASRSTSCARLGGDRLMCGVFGIRSPDRDVARLAYFGLYALQHRGQESAGIAVSDGGRLTVLRDMGLVDAGLRRAEARGLHGELAIGHTRYSTTGSTQWANAQPLVHHGRARTVALGHNGNLTNAAELRDELARARRPPRLDLRQRGDRRADRERRRAARGGGRAHDARSSRAPTRSSRSPRAGCSPSATRTASGRSASAGSATTGSSRRRRARSTSSAPSFEREMRPRRARARSTRTACSSLQAVAADGAARSASSSSSTSPGPTRGSPASRCTARACGWASGSPRRRRSRPTSCCRSPTRARRPRSASRARPGSRSARG